jgi:hypothetical protein
MPKRAPMDPVRILGVGVLRCDHCKQPGHSFEDCPHADAPAVALARSAEWASQQRAATVDPAMCPRCKGDNSEAFELCATCASAPAVVAEPGKER